MKKIKVFIVRYKTVIISISFILILAGIVRLYERCVFNNEHPLVNRVYKMEWIEKPAAGGTVHGTMYYVFGNDDYRDKVVEVYGGIKEVKKMMHNKDEYKKQFEDVPEEYIVKGGKKLIIDTDVEGHYEDSSYQKKHGETWIGKYNTSDNKSIESHGELHKTTPIEIK